VRELDPRFSVVLEWTVRDSGFVVVPERVVDLGFLVAPERVVRDIMKVVRRT